MELVDGPGPSEDEISDSVPPADYTQPDQRHDPKAYVLPYVTDESDELSISLDPSAVHDERPGVLKTDEAAMRLRCRQEDKNSTLPESGLIQVMQVEQNSNMGRKSNAGSENTR